MSEFYKETKHIFGDLEIRLDDDNELFIYCNTEMQLTKKEIDDLILILSDLRKKVEA